MSCQTDPVIFSALGQNQKMYGLIRMINCAHLSMVILGGGYGSANKVPALKHEGLSLVHSTHIKVRHSRPGRFLDLIN